MAIARRERLAAFVALHFTEIPWDKAFAWIVASCGWISHADAKAIHVELPTAGK